MASTVSTASSLSRALKRQSSIVRLTEQDRAALLAHYLSLAEDDRNCRFGAGCSDAAVARYVAGLDLAREGPFAVRASDGEIVAVAHVPHCDGVAELGISVLPHARRRGLGLLLAQRAMREARRLGAREFSFHFAGANEGMRKLAARLRMSVERLDSEWIARRPLAVQNFTTA
jgi:GNAT superfamily N-acetyltransferase